MQQRRMGGSGLRVSRLGLGTLTWGRDTDEHEARDQLTTFVDAGGSLLDTAAGYADGASEELIGRLLRDVVPREDVVVATKAGIGRRRGERVTDVSRGALLRTLDASLRRLDVDHVDLWQVHTWSDDVPLEETLGALETAVTSGRAAYVGVSNYSGWQLARAATLGAGGPAPVTSTQVEYSLLNRAVEAEVLPAAVHLGVGVLAWSPLGRGVLTGKYRTGTPADSRAASPHFAGFGDGGPPDRDARLVWATCGGLRVASMYVPNGRELTDEHYTYKLGWLERLATVLEGRPADRSHALCGDFNIAPADDDVWDMRAFADGTHVSAPERAAFERVLGLGFRDALRSRHPDAGLYTYWDYRGGAFHKRQGMRIDHVLLDGAAADTVSFAFVDRNARKGEKPSDHTVLMVEVEPG